MRTTVDEVADGVYRIATFLPEVAPRGFTFNQFLLDAEEPLLYHTGMRSLFPVVSEAVASVLPLERLRWIAFSHVEADECGAVEQFLTAAPHASVAHGALGCELSLDDMLSRRPVALTPGQVLDLGGKELGARAVRQVDTPHVPHNWESQVFFEQTTRTLLCGDLGSQLGDPGPFAQGDLVAAAIETEHVFRASSLSAAVPQTLRRLADLHPEVLAVMHGGSARDGESVLRSLATAYEEEFPAMCLPGELAVPGQGRPGAHTPLTAGQG